MNLKFYILLDYIHFSTEFINSCQLFVYYLHAWSHTLMCATTIIITVIVHVDFLGSAAGVDWCPVRTPIIIIIIIIVTIIVTSIITIIIIIIIVINIVITIILTIVITIIISIIYSIIIAIISGNRRVTTTEITPESLQEQKLPYA